MKKLGKNEKGFTLIELLAVIVILAILIAVAIPATMRYLAQARRGTFASNIGEAINVVRNDITLSGKASGTYYYDMTAINNLLEKQIDDSPYGGDLKGTKSYILVTYNSTTSRFDYTVCMVDSLGNGFNAGTTEEQVINETDFQLTTGTACTTPTTASKATTYPNGGRTTFAE